MSKRGGKRRGAGAPKGNINALSTGAHSKAIRELLEKTPEGIWILNKKTRKLVFVYREQDLERLKREGMSI